MQLLACSPFSANISPACPSLAAAGCYQDPGMQPDTMQPCMLVPDCLQAAAKLKDMEGVMIKFYEANLDKAGMGLEILPGVKQMLEELMVSGMSSGAAVICSNDRSSAHVTCCARWTSRPCLCAAVIHSGLMNSPAALGRCVRRQGRLRLCVLFCPDSQQERRSSWGAGARQCVDMPGHWQPGAYWLGQDAGAGPEAALLRTPLWRLWQ